VSPQPGTPEFDLTVAALQDQLTHYTEIVSDLETVARLATSLEDAKRRIEGEVWTVQHRMATLRTSLAQLLVQVKPASAPVAKKGTR